MTHGELLEQPVHSTDKYQLLPKSLAAAAVSVASVHESSKSMASGFCLLCPEGKFLSGGVAAQPASVLTFVFAVSSQYFSSNLQTADH